MELSLQARGSHGSKRLNVFVDAGYGQGLAKRLEPAEGILFRTLLNLLRRAEVVDSTRRS